MMQKPFVVSCLLIDYQALPEAVKATISIEDYNGMGHEQRASLVEDMVTPDGDDDEVDDL